MKTIQNLVLFVATMLYLFSCNTDEGESTSPTPPETPSTTYSQDLTITSQAQLDSFFEIRDWESLTGDLILDGSDITDLSSLNTLESIDGKLEIKNTPNLTSLTDFSSLTSLGSLILEQTTGFTSLDGLDKLSGSIETIKLESPDLSDISALKGLTEVTNVLELVNLDSLTDFSGLGSLTSIDEVIFNNLDKLTNLDFLTNLVSASAISFLNNPSLSDFAGLESVIKAITDLQFTATGNEENPDKEDIAEAGSGSGTSNCSTAGAASNTLNGTDEGSTGLKMVSYLGPIEDFNTSGNDNEYQSISIWKGPITTSDNRSITLYLKEIPSTSKSFNLKNTPTALGAMSSDQFQIQIEDENKKWFGRYSQDGSVFETEGVLKSSIIGDSLTFSFDCITLANDFRPSNLEYTTKEFSGSFTIPLDTFLQEKKFIGDLLGLEAEPEISITADTIWLKNYPEHPANGTLLGNMNAMASDGSTLTYSNWIPPLIPDQRQFIEIESNGDIKVVNSDFWDFENLGEFTNMPIFQRTIEVCTRDGETCQNFTFRAELIDVKELMVDDIALTVEENQPNATTLENISATSNNSSDFTYEIIEETPSGAISVNTTGEIKVKDTDLFDYETLTSLTAKVKVSDGYENDTIDITISLTDIVNEGTVAATDVPVTSQV